MATAKKSAERTHQKSRTRRFLLEAAAKLLAAGESPSVAEVADSAGVSRRTAYRYFTSARRLHADAALETLRPAMELAIDSSTPSTSLGDIEIRVHAMVESMQRLASQNETLLRTMIHETVMTPSSTGAPRRGTRRVEWIESAIVPLRKRLGPAAYKRLVSSLALCTGIESLLVLRDICCLSPAEATRVAQWMCRVLVRDSLSENAADRRKRRARAKATASLGAR